MSILENLERVLQRRDISELSTSAPTTGCMTKLSRELSEMKPVADQAMKVKPVAEWKRSAND